MDAGRVPRMGQPGRKFVRLSRPVPAGWRGRPGGGPVHPACRLPPGGCMNAAVARGLGIPELSLVVLIGASGSGKSTFARAHFRPTEVISSDFCRALVSDDENDLSATDDAFDILHYVA